MQVIKYFNLLRADIVSPRLGTYANKSLDISHPFAGSKCFYSNFVKVQTKLFSYYLEPKKIRRGK